MDLHKNKKRQQKIKKSLLKYKDRLLEIPGVNDLGVGFKFTGKTYTDELAIVIEVKEKYLDRYQKDSTIIPQKIEDISINIIPSPVPELLNFSQDDLHPKLKEISDNRNDFYEQLTGGIRIRNARRNGYGGTLGAVVYDRDTDLPYGITARHVLIPNRSISFWKSAPVIQPDKNKISNAKIGSVFFNKKKELDCIRFRLNKSRDIDMTQSCIGLEGKIKGIETEIICGTKVMKSGATTGITYGIIVCESLCQNRFVIFPDEDYKLIDDELSLAGDSGAIWILNDGSMKAIGLHSLGNRRKNIDVELSIALKMDRVADYLNIKF